MLADRRAVTVHLRESGKLTKLGAAQHIIGSASSGTIFGPGHFSTANMAKDIALFIEMTMQRGTPALLAGTAAACYRGTIALGYAADYHPVVIRWLEAGAAAHAASRAASVNHAAVLNAISGGVVALQTLANIEALQALRETGISTIDAAEHLMSGSAANDSLGRRGALDDDDQRDGARRRRARTAARTGGAEQPCPR